MKKRYALGLLSLCTSMLLASPSWAGDISPDQLKAYADIYPDMFQASTQNVSYQPSGNHGQAVNLLMDSFNGNTDVDGLSAVLRPSDRSAMKSEAQIKQLLGAKGLSWQEYLTITHAIASDRNEFERFTKLLDNARLKRTVLMRSDEDSSFQREIGAIDHQIIVKNLVENSRK